VRRTAVFSNWLHLKRVILEQSQMSTHLVIDFTQTRLVDHSVMEKLHELEVDFAAHGKRVEVVFSENHVPLGASPHAGRRKNSSE
jgi:MFS superfamily sulfate permease-like transporter